MTHTCLRARMYTAHPQVRGHFRPEFINRVDEFIIFDPLSQDQIQAIVRLQVRVWVGMQDGGMMTG